MTSSGTHTCSWSCPVTYRSTNTLDKKRNLQQNKFRAKLPTLHLHISLDVMCSAVVKRCITKWFIRRQLRTDVTAGLTLVQWTTEEDPTGSGLRVCLHHEHTSCSQVTNVDLLERSVCAHTHTQVYALSIVQQDQQSMQTNTKRRFCVCLGCLPESETS